MKVAKHTTAAVLTEPVKQASGDVRPLIHTVKAGLATVPVDGNELPEEIAELDDEKELSSVYFTQVLLPDYVAAHPGTTAGWDLLWDDRGHSSEPHTETEIGLGTLSVREYLAACHTTKPSGGLDVDPIETAYPTHGPRNRYQHVLLIEKEGFQQLFNHAQIEKRYDLAIMSSKGMNTTEREHLTGLRVPPHVTHEAWRFPDRCRAPLIERLS